MPAFQGGGVELAVRCARRRGPLPRLAGLPARQPIHDHRQRVQVSGHHAVIEGGHHLVAAQAPPALLADDAQTLELDQPTWPPVVSGPSAATTPRAAVARPRWYARGGSVISLRSRAATHSSGGCLLFGEAVYSPASPLRTIGRRRRERPGADGGEGWAGRPRGRRPGSGCPWRRCPTCADPRAGRTGAGGPPRPPRGRGDRARPRPWRAPRRPGGPVQRGGTGGSRPGR